jgi:predicted RNA-binding protein with PIN domain
MLHYLLDGYNLLYALPEMPRGTWPEKRDALLRRLAQEGSQGANRVTVVFDSREGLGDRARVSGMDVIFTAAETADDWITRYVREVPQPRTLVVVTDDKGLWHMVRGTGAKVMTTADFWKSRRRERSSPRDSGLHDSITDEMKKKWLG